MAARKVDPSQHVFRPLSECPGFVLAKPLQQDAYNPEEIEKLEKEGRLMITRKRDGWKLFVEKHKGEIKIYTDGMRDITDKLPHIVYELEKLKLPNKTRFVGEGVIETKSGDERLKAASIFLMAKQKALDLQQQIGHIKFIRFDTIFWDGHCILQKPYYARSEVYGINFSKMFANIRRLSKNRGPINRKKERRIHEEGFRFISDVERIGLSLQATQEVVIKIGWEGLVLYDSRFQSDFRLDGKAPQRIRGCYKWKPIKEDDFIVRSWNPSEKDPERLKDVNLSQIDPVTKKEFNCGKFGNFSGAMREQLKKTTYPFVIQLKFEMRYPSGKLQSASFMDLRPDKKPEACIASKSYTPK